MESKKKILVVDDDSVFTELNKKILEKNNFNVAVAYNGNECLEMVANEKPDLIILDVMMRTKSDGFDTARALRKIQQTENTPIIMVTSINDTVAIRFEADEEYLPVNKFIEKPIKPQALLEMVNEILNE